MSESINVEGALRRLTQLERQRSAVDSELATLEQGHARLDDARKSIERRAAELNGERERLERRRMALDDEQAELDNRREALEIESDEVVDGREVLELNRKALLSRRDSLDGKYTELYWALDRIGAPLLPTLGVPTYVPPALTDIADGAARPIDPAPDNWFAAAPKPEPAAERPPPASPTPRPSRRHWLWLAATTAAIVLAGTVAMGTATRADEPSSTLEPTIGPSMAGVLPRVMSDAADRTPPTRPKPRRKRRRPR